MIHIRQRRGYKGTTPDHQYHYKQGSGAATMMKV